MTFLLLHRGSGRIAAALFAIAASATALIATPAYADSPGAWAGLSISTNADGYTNANLALEASVLLHENISIRATAAEDTMSAFLTGVLPIGDVNLFAGPGITMTEGDYFNGSDWHDRAEVAIAARAGAEVTVFERGVIFGQVDAAESVLQGRVGLGYQL